MGDMDLGRSHRIGSMRNRQNSTEQSSILCDSKWIGLPPMDVSNSTRIATMARNDNAVEELLAMSTNNGISVTKPINSINDKSMELSVAYVRPTTAQNNNKQLSKSNQNGPDHSANISVDLFTASRQRMMQNLTASNGSSITDFPEKLERYWQRIDEHTKSFLGLNKEDLIRNGLLYDDAFKNDFLSCTSDRIAGTFAQFLRTQRFFGQFLSGKAESAQRQNQSSGARSTGHSVPDKQDGFETSSPYDLDLNDVSNVCEEQTDQPPEPSDSILGCDYDDNDINHTAISSNLNRPHQQLRTTQVESNMIQPVSAAETSQTVVVRSQPPIEKRKRKMNNAQASGNVTKKAKLVDAVKNPFKCEWCEYSALYKSHLTRHIRIHNGDRPFECEFCNKKFNRKDLLHSHMRTHRDISSFECSKCRQPFSREKELKLHETRCNAKLYECYLCNAIISRKEQLVGHMRKHTGDRLHCSKCPKRFCSTNALQRHMRSHGKSFPFQCSNCREGFTNKETWTAHESRCKRKQFECYLCRKKYHHQSGDLLQHMRYKHTGERPFKCTHCKKRFYMKSQLNDHVKCVHKKNN